MSGAAGTSPARCYAHNEGAAVRLFESDTRWVLILCALSALRVFLFSAAFPFFSNVDEQGHFDLVCKYSRGHVPRSLERFDADAARLIVLYDTPEYFDKPEQYPGGVFPPPRRIATPGDREGFDRQVNALLETDNHESTQPPLYYALAGAWYRLGAWAGLHGGRALYFTRFLNPILCGLLTWLAFVFARSFFPDRAFLRLGVPLLVTFLPQDAFYLVNNDVLLPLVGGAAFLAVLLACGQRPRGYAFNAAAGGLTAAVVLVKLSSIAIVPVALGMVAYSVWTRSDPADRRRAIAKGAVLLLAAFVPVGLWCARNYVLLHDVTGSVAKAQILGWTLKPMGAVFSHPIFTLSGLTLFWQETLATFWRGELVWSLRPIASPAWDRTYGISSALFLSAALVAPWTWRKPQGRGDRFVLWPSFALFALSLAFLAAVSVAYDFGDCFYPSRAAPYMTSGRLASGALLPFAALYVYGFDVLLPRRLGTPFRFAALIVPLALLTVSECVLSKPVFESAYNWFHL
jgi:hypothetical protein